MKKVIRNLGGVAAVQSVVERLFENSAYTAGFKQLFGDAVFEDAENAYAANA